VYVQLVALVEDEGGVGAGPEAQCEWPVQAAAVKPPQLAPRAQAGDDEVCRLYFAA
jgi:hypothetical protein